MKLGSQMDYHGSRAYAPDVPSAAPGGWIKRHSERLAAWAKKQLEMVLRPGAEQAAEAVWLVHGGERHFSILGSGDDAGKRRRAAALVRPLREPEVRIRRPLRDRLDRE